MAGLIIAAGIISIAVGYSLPNTRYNRVGGIRFFRIGRAQISFCRCRASI